MTRIRPATTDDVARIAEITEAAARAHGPRAYDDAQVEAWVGGDEAPEDLVTPDDDDHWIVAEREGTVVAWGRADADASEITGSYVHPDHARDGVGATVVAALEGYLRGAGCETATLVASKNAVGFYEHLGYEAVDTVDHGTDDVAMECLEMRKVLEAT